VLYNSMLSIAQTKTKQKKYQENKDARNEQD